MSADSLSPEIPFELFAVSRGRPSPKSGAELVGRAQHAACFVFAGHAEIQTPEGPLCVEAGQGLFVSVPLPESNLGHVTDLLIIRFTWSDPFGRALGPREKIIPFRFTDRPAMVSVAEELQRHATDRDGRTLPAETLRSLPYVDYQKLIGCFHLWLAETAALLESLGFKVEAQDETDLRLRTALAFLDKHPLDRALEQATLSSACGLGRAQIERLFRFHLQTTPRAYLERRRAKEACLQLTRKIPIKEIAAGLGFSSLSRFSAWFSRVMKQSPRAYRKRFGSSLKAPTHSSPTAGIPNRMMLKTVNPTHRFGGSPAAMLRDALTPFASSSSLPSNSMEFIMIST